MSEPIWCMSCGQQFIPPEWADSGWGDGPHAGLGICSCASGDGFPILQEGDLLVSRGHTADFVKSTTYGYRGENIMAVQRKYIDDVGFENWPVIWIRKQGE